MTSDCKDIESHGSVAGTADSLHHKNVSGHSLIVLFIYCSRRTLILRSRFRFWGEKETALWESSTSRTKTGTEWRQSRESAGSDSPFLLTTTFKKTNIGPDFFFYRYLTGEVLLRLKMSFSKEPWCLFTYHLTTLVNLKLFFRCIFSFIVFILLLNVHQ